MIDRPSLTAVAGRRAWINLECVPDLSAQSVGLQLVAGSPLRCYVDTSVLSKPADCLNVLPLVERRRLGTAEVRAHSPHRTSWVFEVQRMALVCILAAVADSVAALASRNCKKINSLLRVKSS